MPILQVYEDPYQGSSWTTWTSSLPTEMMSTVRWKVISLYITLQPPAQQAQSAEILSLHVNRRDRSGHDVCNKPRDGHVLGNVTLECHGNHGDSPPPILPLQTWSLRTRADWHLPLFCTRRHTQSHASSIWYRLCASRQSITTSRGIKWRCSFLSSTTRSVSHR